MLRITVNNWLELGIYLGLGSGKRKQGAHHLSMPSLQRHIFSSDAVMTVVLLLKNGTMDTAWIRLNRSRLLKMTFAIF